MPDFTIRIAELNIGVSSLFTSTREYFKSYLTEESGEYHITVTAEALAQEQAALDAEADELGLRRRVFTDPFLERTVIQRKTAAFALRDNTLLLHGSTVVMDGKAYLFTAQTGVGKSTHTRLWQKVFGSRVQILNDDRAFLHLEKTVTAYGSPWSGKHGLDCNISAPLAGICILQRGSENRIQRISPEEAMPELLHQMYLPDSEMDADLSALTKSLADIVPLWRMQCTKDDAAAKMAFETMGAGTATL